MFEIVQPVIGHIAHPVCFLKGQFLMADDTDPVTLSYLH